MGGSDPKIKFSRQESCANDGSVEFCVPENDQELMAALAAISSTISCAPGGGRARCFDSPNLLLCSYPTAYPGECTADHGAMTDPVWSDMCEIAALPQIKEIVHTIFE